MRHPAPDVVGVVHMLDATAEGSTGQLADAIAAYGFPVFARFEGVGVKHLLANGLAAPISVVGSAGEHRHAINGR